MRRLTALVLAGAAALLLTSCGTPAGVDGDLVDDWAPLAEAKPFVPSAGVCQSADFAETAYLASYSPVDCGTAHRLETVHVGTFTGAVAARPAPPAQRSPDLRTAFDECDAKATEYVGTQWRAGRLWLGVAVPSARAWTAGSRWFRCDVTELTSVEDDGDTASRTASVKGVLAHASALNLGCYAVRLDDKQNIDSMPPADCAKRHNAEFVGIWRAPDVPFPTKDADWSRFYTECRSVMATYVGLPDDGNLRYRAGIVALPSGPAEWRIGNRGVRCYVWRTEPALTRTLKGAGPAALPIQFK